CGRAVADDPPALLLPRVPDRGGDLTSTDRTPRPSGGSLDGGPAGTAGATCPSCGTMFAALRSDHRYCSSKCKKRAYDRRRRADPQAKTSDLVPEEVPN